MNLYGIILAGGESSRMGYPKPLLEINGKSFADIITEKMRLSGTDKIHIVLGARSGEIKKNLNAGELNIIINPHWKKGQLSSLKAALKNIPEDADGIIVSLIDHPMVREDTIKKLAETFRKEKPHGVVPVYEGRSGHPVIFSKKVFKDLLRAPLEVGARAVVKSVDFNFLRVEVDDPHIRQDIDTLEEYREISGK